MTMEVNGNKKPRPSQTPADLKLIAQSFSRCRTASEGIKTDHYLCAVNELIRLFHQLGGGTDLALRGIDSAVKTLEIRRVSGAGCHYQSLPWLVQHEFEEGMAMKQGTGRSGVTAVVELQLALRFMIAFLDSLADAFRQGAHWDASARMRTYEDTLGKQHSLFKQAAVKTSLALGAGRKQIMKNLTSSFHGDCGLLQQMDAIVAEAKPVYDIIDKVLKQYTQLARPV